MMPFYDEQLRFMAALALERGPYLNKVFLFLNYVDTSYFNIILIPLFWIGISSRWGIRLYYLLLCNWVINSYIKALVGWPRPCTDIPNSGLLDFHSFGFPSGAAQTSMLMGALLIYYWKNKYSWLIAVGYVSLISFSRLYLGVHYPIDILGGWVIGLGLFYLFISTDKYIEKYLKSKNLFYSCSIIIIVPLILMFIFPHQIQQYKWSSIALAIGTYISLKHDLYLAPAKNRYRALARGGVAASVNLLIYILLKDHFSNFVEECCTILWVSLAASLFLGIIPVMGRKANPLSSSA